MRTDIIKAFSSPSDGGRLVIVGGGPAGLAAAAKARESGVKDILVLERDARLGGILNQCVHSGFGLHMFGEELTGPEYASRLEKMADGIDYLTNTTVLNITPSLEVECVSREGIFTIKADAVVLACGCRERPRGAIGIPGARCSGVYTAGTAQKLININGVMPGKKFFILGSGDIGLIMARRAVLQGGEVLGVAEIMPYSSGLKRNIAQCLDDYGVPLMLSHTVTDIREKDGRLCGITVSRVDEKLSPVPGTERDFECDTLLLSVGLIPETELLRSAGAELDKVTGGAVADERMMTSVDGLFCVGNMLHVHDLADYACKEAEECAVFAAQYLSGEKKRSKTVRVNCSGGVRYTVPQLLLRDFDGALSLKLRVGNVAKNVYIAAYADGEEVYSAFRRVVAPGEMEYLTLSKEKAEKLRKAERVEVKLKEKR